MGKWSDRVAVYKFTVINAYFVFLVYSLAFAIPMWFGLEVGGVDTISGLWAAGLGDSGDIEDVDATGFDNDGDPDWKEAVRGLWVAGMAFYLIGIVASVAENWCMHHDSRDYGVSGFCILFAGLCGGAGVITTAIEVEDDDNGTDYLWGYILAVVSSGLAIIIAIVLLISKNYGITHAAKNSRTADYVYAHNKHLQQQHHHHHHPHRPQYNNPGYRGDELPLVNGVPYHQPTTPYGHSPYSMYKTGHDNNGFAGNKYDQGSGYYPYGYKDTRPGNRTSMAESADLSNGYTQDIMHAENSLGRRGDYGGSRLPQQSSRGEHYYNGSRPY